MSTTAAKTKTTVELMRKGAVMIKEPCTVCNGVQLRYKGRVYCTNHDDLSVALQAREILFPDVSEDLKNLLLVKLKESMSLLENESDSEKQDRLVSLMTKYVELLRKLEPAQRA
ncbi:MAG: autoantigen p27 domain-containing protein [Thaumarchaeota archaeon]|nr:autoantigen p27 domain-containing protein [Nitrososphaerota archaeon]